MQSGNHLIDQHEDSNSDNENVPLNKILCRRNPESSSRPCTKVGQRGREWQGTLDEGLFRRNGTAVKNVTSEEPSPFISEDEEDGNWMSDEEDSDDSNETNDDEEEKVDESCSDEMDYDSSGEERGSGQEEDMGRSGGKGNLDEKIKDVFHGRRKAVKIIAPGTTISSRGLMTYMGVSGHTKGSLGIKKVRKIGLRKLDERSKRKLLLCFRNIVVKAAHAFLPEEPERLIRESLNGLQQSQMDSNDVQTSLAVCKKASLEKRFMRALIYGCMGRHAARKVLARDVQNVERVLKLGKHGCTGSSVDDEGTVQSEDINARLKEVMESQERKWSGNFRTVMNRARQDWLHFEKRGFIPKRIQRRMKVADETVMDAVKYIFEPGNRQLLATGSKKVRLRDGCSVQLPCVRRTKSRLQTYAGYLERKKQVPMPRKLGRSSFMKIIGAVTSGQQQMKHCVDYCFGVLLFENFRTVKHIIENRVNDVCTRNELIAEIEAVSDYLKHGFSSHIDRDLDSIHDSRRALVGQQECSSNDNIGNPLENISSVSAIELDASMWEGRLCVGTCRRSIPATCAAERQERVRRNDLWKSRSKCSTCLSCFQVIENVRSHVPDNEDGIGDVLDDASSKLKLFIGHTVRCKVQNSVIDEAYEELLRNQSETFGVLTMDYKMKYEPKKYRQKSSDWYGRKGISWHGTVLTYKSREEEGETERRGQSVDSENQLGSVKHKFYDHICRNTSEQSTFAVLSIIELVAHHMKKENPTITKVILRTDNAANYHNRVLPVVAPFIFNSYGIQLVSIMHNETQDGKGPADLHFAVVTLFVDRYIESRGMDVVTPLDLANAINHGNGLKGTVAELFDVNVENENMKTWLQEQKKKAKESAFQVIGRCNVIDYEYDDIEEGKVLAKTREYKYSKEVRWIFRLFSSTRDSTLTDMVPVMTLPNCTVRGSQVMEGRTRTIEQLGEDSDEPEIYAVQEGRVLFTGPMTGVKIVTSGQVQRAATPSKAIARRLYLQNLTKGDRRQTGNHDSDGSSDDYSEEDIVDVEKKYRFNGMFYYCRKCGMSYNEESDVLKHWTACSARGSSCHVVDRACKGVPRMIEMNKIIVMTSPTENPCLQRIKVGGYVRSKVLFHKNWAVRPAKGHTLGKNFIEPFKAEIRAMVDRGRGDKGKKLSCAQMQEQLQLSHPNRFDIPSVHNINSFVTSCLRVARREAERTAQETEARDAESQRVIAERTAQPVEPVMEAVAEAGEAERQSVIHAGEANGNSAVDNPVHEAVRIVEASNPESEGQVQSARQASTAMALDASQCRGGAGDAVNEGNGQDSYPEGMEEEQPGARNVVAARRSDGAIEPQSTKRYVMPLTYANIIEEVVRADPKVKPLTVVAMVLEALNTEPGKEASDVPSSHQITRKVGSVKKKLKREKARGA